jgi:hypothetical protein
MLHGDRRFGNETGPLANQLFSFFYRDHELYYTGLQNLVLHLHTHLVAQYNNYGSLSNTNTFAQEDLIGHLSKSKHGTRYWGDLLAFYYNVSYLLRHCLVHRLSFLLD